MRQVSIEAAVTGAAKSLLKSNVIFEEIVDRILYGTGPRDTGPRDTDPLDIESPADSLKTYSEYDEQRDALVETIIQSLTGKSANQFGQDHAQNDWGQVLDQMSRHPLLAQPVQDSSNEDPYCNVLGAVEVVLDQELAKATCLIWDISKEMGIIEAKKEPVDEDELEQLGDVDEKMRQAYDEALTRLENGDIPT